MKARAPYELTHDYLLLSGKRAIYTTSRLDRRLLHPKSGETLEKTRSYLEFTLTAGPSDLLIPHVLAYRSGGKSYRYFYPNTSWTIDGPHTFRMVALLFMFRYGSWAFGAGTPNYYHYVGNGVLDQSYLHIHPRFNWEPSYVVRMHAKNTGVTFPVSHDSAYGIYAVDATYTLDTTSQNATVTFRDVDTGSTTTYTSSWTQDITGDIIELVWIRFGQLTDSVADTEYFYFEVDGEPKYLVDPTLWRWRVCMVDLTSGSCVDPSSYVNGGLKLVLARDPLIWRFAGLAPTNTLRIWGLTPGSVVCIGGNCETLEEPNPFEAEFDLYIEQEVKILYALDDLIPLVGESKAEISTRKYTEHTLEVMDFAGSAVSLETEWSW